MDEIIRLHQALLAERRAALDWSSLLRHSFVFQSGEYLEAARAVVDELSAEIGEPYRSIADWLAVYPPAIDERLPIITAEIASQLPPEDGMTLALFDALFHDLRELGQMAREGADRSKIIGENSLLRASVQLSERLGDHAIAAKIMEIGGAMFIGEADEGSANPAVAKLGGYIWRQIAAKWSDLARNHSPLYLSFAAVSLSNQAALQVLAFDCEDAVVAIQEALTLLDQMEEIAPGDYRPQRAMWLNTLARAKATLRHFDDQLKYSRESVRLYQDLLGPEAAPQEQFNLAAALIGLAQVETTLGDEAPAREHMQAAIELMARIFPAGQPERPVRLVLVYHIFATAALSWGEFDTARHYWSEAVVVGQIWREQSPGLLLPPFSFALIGLGRIELESERPAKALPLFQQALPDLLAMHELNRESVRAQLAELLLSIGQAENTLGNLAKARETLEQAATYLTRQSDGAAGLMIYRELALLALRLGFGAGRPDHARAHHLFGRACREAESWRSIYSTAERRSAIQAQIWDIFDRHLRHCLHWWGVAPEGQKPAIFAEAFRTAEASRSRRLLDQLTASGGWQPRFIPPEIAAELRQYDAPLQIMHQQEMELAKGLTIFPAPQNFDAAEKLKLEEQRAALIDKFLRQYPGARLEPDVAVQEAEAIFDLIPTDVPTAFIQFVIDEEFAYALVLQADRSITPVEYNPEVGSALAILASTWPKALEMNGTMASSAQDAEDTVAYAEILSGQVMKQLFDQVGPVIVRPLTELLCARGIARVVISSHRALHLLPLHACPPEPGAETLADLMEVIYTPSFSLLYQLMHASAARQGLPTPSFLLLEDPTRDISAKALFFTRYEAAALRRQFRACGGLDIQWAAGNAVTQNQLVARSLEARVLHYSGHGRFEQTAPTLSRLQFSGRPATVDDIYTAVALPDNDLTFLNCCESGRMSVDEFDNFQNFTTAFLCSGARCVISTLWSVHDLPSALLVDEFYRQVLAGIAPAAALRAAQRHLRSLTIGTSLTAAISRLIPDDAERLNRESALEVAAAYARYTGREQPFDSPFYWAGFTCHGAGFLPVRLQS